MNLIESLTAPAAFVPLIVGCIFLAIGVTMLTHRIRFRASSGHTTGKVVAIEKYTSTHGTGSDKTKGTFYRPIVEYKYNEQKRTVKGASFNEIRHKLSQNVPVLIKVSDDGTQIQDAVDDPIDSVFATIMALMGIAALVVYIFNVGGSWSATLVFAATAIGLGHIISSAMLNFKETIIKTTEEPERKDSVLIETKADFVKEVSQYVFWGWLMTFLLLIGGLWTLYTGFNMLPEDAAQLIINDTAEFWNTLTGGQAPEAWKKPLTITGIGLFMVIITIRPIVYLRKKYGPMIKF